MGELILLNPWLLIGMAGASLPVLIHLIGRRRAPTVRFAAFDFLLAVNTRLARRERLRQLLLLLLRTLAIIALVLAVTRPMRDRPAAAAVGNRRLVLVIDASASMAYEKDGTPLLSEAKRQALDVISHLQPGEPVTLVIAGQETRTPFQSPTMDHDAVRTAIEAIESPRGVADLGGAIDSGLSQLGTDGASAVLVVISDLSVNSFESLRPTNLEPPPEVHLIDAASPLVRDEGAAALGNIGIEGVRVERSDRVPSERRFEVLVRNYGGGPVQGRAVELIIDGKVTHRGYLDVPARGSEEKTLTHNFESPGIFTGQVRLVRDDADGFEVDDTASFVTEITRGVRVLAVNGDPRTTPYEDELFFFERAVMAVPKGDPPIELRMVTLDELGDADLSCFDVVVLANVGTLPQDVVAKLRGHVDAGKGLLLTLGERVRFETANEDLGALLPHPLRDLHRAADADAGTPPVGIGEVDWDHPILAGLGLEVEQSLRASRTTSYFNLDVGSGIKSRAILRFDNGAPALVEGRADGGRVMLLATSLDVDHTDIPLRSSFPPLMQRAVRYLADAVESVPPGRVRQGGTVEIPLPTGAKGLALTSPTGKRREVTVSEASGRRAVLRDLDEIGIHRAEVLRDSWQVAPALSVAVNPSLLESDFMPVSADRVSEALGGGEGARGRFSVFVGAGAQVDPFEVRGLATYLLVALCLFFVGESLLASRG